MKKKNSEEPVFVLFDREEEYTMNMGEYLKKHTELPWKLKFYTSLDSLLEGEKQSELSMLVVSESSYNEIIKSLKYDRLVILSEVGFKEETEAKKIDKYQAAENVMHMLLEIYLEIAGKQPSVVTGAINTFFIGVYSPIKRCLQTTFALTCGELLSEKHKTLYLSFESYSGMRELTALDRETDLSDLVYFLNADIEKFKLHFRSIVKEYGSLDYVAPMKYGQNMTLISQGEWLNLMRKISELGIYDYVVMDLTDNMQGLLEILKYCNKIYTISQNDKYAQSKISQYEMILNEFEYKDVVEKTETFVLPRFRFIPEALDQFTRGELAEYVRDKISELEAS